MPGWLLWELGGTTRHGDPRHRGGNPVGDPRHRGGDRGDIAGWVMVAIMSAAVVVVLIPFVGPLIAHLFAHAINSVAGTPSAP